MVVAANITTTAMINHQARCPVGPALKEYLIGDKGLGIQQDRFSVTPKRRNDRDRCWRIFTSNAIPALWLLL